MKRIMQTSDFISKRIKYLLVKAKKLFIFKEKEILFLNLTVSLRRPLLGTPNHITFPGKIFHVKRPQPSETTKIRLHLEVSAFIQVCISFPSAQPVARKLIFCVKIFSLQRPLVPDFHTTVDIP